MIFPKPLARGLVVGGIVVCIGLPAAPTVAVAAECAGDECQVVPPPPEEVIPGTAVVAGPENPPVRFPGHHKSKHHRKHHHRGRG